MRAVEKSARTVDDAVAQALQELGVTANQVKVEVLEEPRAGLFGLLARNALVRVTVRVQTPVPPVPPAQPGPARSVAAANAEGRAERVQQFLMDVCRAMEMRVQLEVRETAETLHVDVSGEEAGLLIGHHGQTLDALQFLSNLVAAKEGTGPRVVLDVEGYRRRREETLTRLAERLADRVQRSGERVALEPMSAHERRVIHMALAEHGAVTTSSEGEEPNRRVVILPKR